MWIFLVALVSADPMGRFIDDYPAEVRALKQEFAEVRGTAKVRSIKDGKPGPPSAFRFATGPGRRKFEFDSPDRAPSKKGSPSRYGYAELDGRNIEVQRAGLSEPYSVMGIGDNDTRRRAFFDSIFGNYLNAPWGFGGYEIEDAASRGWLSADAAREVEVDGRILIEVTFRQVKAPEPTFYRATFDPSHRWAIVKGSVWTANAREPSERFEATYGPNASGRDYLKSIRWWGLDGIEKLCDFEEVEFASTPPSEFTLEHYGLKSPPLPARGPNYKVILAIVALAIGLLFGAWFTRRLAMR